MHLCVNIDLVVVQRLQLPDGAHDCAAVAHRLHHVAGARLTCAVSLLSLSNQLWLPQGQPVRFTVVPEASACNYAILCSGNSSN